MKILRNRKFLIFARVLLFLGATALLVLSVPLYVKYKSRNKIFTQVSNIGEYEFILVPGAGIKRNGKPGSYLKKRLDDAFYLYENNKAGKILLSGDNGNTYHDEITVMNRYLVQKGVPQNKIFADYAGFDTYSSMERAVEIFDISSAIVVSQYFHLPRSVYIAQDKGIDAIGYVQNARYGRRSYKVREWFATIKAVFDCIIDRKAKYYGEKVDTNGESNVIR